jgi:hypothetical protein
MQYIGIGFLTEAIMKSDVFWDVKEEALYSHDLLFYPFAFSERSMACPTMWDYNPKTI